MKFVSGRAKDIMGKSKNAEYLQYSFTKMFSSALNKGPFQEFS